MRITASHIVNWVEQHAKEAQASLPRWVRRLCYEVGVTRQLSFPAGDSTYIPGWDGVLQHEQGNAWVPQGLSCWEVGCDKDVTKKANKEYLKRTAATPVESRQNFTFVFVSARRWTGKLKWIQAQKDKHEWAAVRAFDADDLEQWLEQRPDVAVQLAEEFGLSGWGVVSLEHYWRDWSRQCSPPITYEALLVDRIQTRDQLIGKLSQDSSAPLIIRADSEMEAVAFVVASVSNIPELFHAALVITAPEGWQYVNANAQLQMVIVAQSEIATTLTTRQGLRVVIPCAAGNIIGNSQQDIVNLPRPNIYDFEKALASIGEEESDAKRLALSTGRSWSVFRRIRAINPAIRHPAWIGLPAAGSLTTLCLIGTWSDSHKADRHIIEQLAGKSYDEMERNLRTLSQLDDAPVLQIGAVWKAKSPLELLHLKGGEITRSELDRFFEVAADILSTPDPQLELSDSERYAAAIHGKIRPHSDLLIESLCDALIKLAVHGNSISSLNHLNVVQRVEKLVSDLLGDASGERWLSLASYLPALAEAAPEAFLKSVETSLSSSEKAVTRLLTETGESGSMGRCWHAGLLWALEVLAWQSKNLARVALILARLCHVPIKGNWGNKPMSSLFGLFRTWLPQTSATVEKRIQVLDLLILKEPNVAFEVLKGLMEWGHQTATPAAQPKWRDDNAGAGKVTEAEMWQMVTAARERLIPCCRGDVDRIAQLIEGTFFTNDVELFGKLLELAKEFAQDGATDEQREKIRTKLRSKLHRYRNYDKTPAEILEKQLEPQETLYQDLAPIDLVLRHRWLFETYWAKLPCKMPEHLSDQRDELLATVRQTAVSEIVERLGDIGVQRLIAECKEPQVVGMSLTKIGWDEAKQVDWVIQHGGNFALGAPFSNCVSGLLRFTPQENFSPLMNKLLKHGESLDWDAGTRARLLMLAYPNWVTWQLVERQDVEVVRIYWCEVNLGWSLPNEKEHLDFVLQRLLAVNRARTALRCCSHALDYLDDSLLLEMLQRFVQGEEPEGVLPESWDLGNMLDKLEKSDTIDKMALIQLEFSLFPVFQYEQKDRVSALYKAMMDEPSFFVQLLCLCFKPSHGEIEASVAEMNPEISTIAWGILHACTRQAGTQANGSIDSAGFIAFIEQVRELSRQADRLDVCDITLGQILAHAPADKNGLAPFSAARELLDRPEMNNVREGFYVGTRNKRGAHSRAMLAGGEQEYNLAQYYRTLAEPLQTSVPNMAALWEEIAKSYDEDAKREDIQADLRKEGY
ncbi:MAG: hypothetical protein PHI11_09640 [Gallionella sp.]|nr:hypothetical protein [Gallionella sp.]